MAEFNTYDLSIKLEPSETCTLSVNVEPQDFQLCLKSGPSDIACDPLSNPVASVQSSVLGEEIANIIDSTRSIPVKAELTIDIEREEGFVNNDSIGLQIESETETVLFNHNLQLSDPRHDDNASIITHGEPVKTELTIDIEREEGVASNDSTILKIESETETVAINHDIQLGAIHDAATIITYGAGSRIKTESIQFDHDTWAQRLKNQSCQPIESTSVESRSPNVENNKKGKKQSKRQKRVRIRMNPVSKANKKCDSLLRAHLEDQNNAEYSENTDIPDALLSVQVEIDEEKNYCMNFGSEFGSRSDTQNVTYQCDLCARSFNYKSSFLTHQLTHSRRNDRLEERTVTEEALKKKTEKTFLCKYCNKKFSQSNDLTRHVRTHTGEKLFSCSICYKKFAQRSDLTRHTRTHTGEKPFKCPVCGKEFGITSNLSQHMRIHTGEKPHDCTICNKKFTHRSDLSKHMSSHTGVKPFECPVCDRKFIQRSDLTKHMNIHTGERPYECKICTKRFIRSTHLSKHMRTHNKNGELDLKAPPTMAVLPIGINSSDASTFMSAAIEAAKMFAANPIRVPTTADKNN